MGGLGAARPPPEETKTMQINFGQVLTAFDGTPLRQVKAEGQPPEDITLRDVAIEALCRATEERGVTGTQKFERFAIAQRIHKGDPVDLKVEEVATLKERIGELFPPLIVGRAFELLEPPA